MIVWRISNHLTIDGAGGLKASGRWHSRGRRIVYCAPNPAGALLEILVRYELGVRDLPRGYKLLKIKIPDHLALEQVEVRTLPEGWRNRLELTRGRGDAWLTAQATVLLSVASVIVPETFNFLINPAHRESRRIEVVDVQEHLFDRRLFGHD